MKWSTAVCLAKQDVATCLACSEVILMQSLTLTIFHQLYNDCQSGVLKVFQKCKVLLSMIHFALSIARLERQL